MTDYRNPVSGALLALLLLGLAPAPPAGAHSNEYLATQSGAHGGMLRMSGPYHLEMRIDRGAVRVWVTDHADNPQNTAGARGQVIVLQGADRFAVDLQPQGENTLHGSDQRIAPTPDARAVLTLSMQGQPPLQVRFAAGAKGQRTDEQAAGGHGGHAGH